MTSAQNFALTNLQHIAMAVSLEALAMAGVDHRENGMGIEEWERQEMGPPPPHLLAEEEEEEEEVYRKKKKKGDEGGTGDDVVTILYHVKESLIGMIPKEKARRVWSIARWFIRANLWYWRWWGWMLLSQSPSIFSVPPKSTLFHTCFVSLLAWLTPPTIIYFFLFNRLSKFSDICISKLIIFLYVIYNFCVSLLVSPSLTRMMLISLLWKLIYKQ